MSVEKRPHPGREHLDPVVMLSEVVGKHRDHCLCFNGCIHFKPGTPENCKIAQAIYETCVKYNVVTPVYECPVFDDGLGDVE